MTCTCDPTRPLSYLLCEEHGPANLQHAAGLEMTSYAEPEWDVSDSHTVAGIQIDSEAAYEQVEETVRRTVPPEEWQEWLEEVLPVIEGQVTGEEILTEDPDELVSLSVGKAYAIASNESGRYAIASWRLLKMVRAHHPSSGVSQ